MGIEQICNKITSFLDKVRTPIATIPSILLVCSAIKRPGLSAMTIAANIIRRQSEAGAPFGPAKSGLSNISEAMERIRVEELVKAMKLDARVQTGIPIGGLQILGTGSCAGGPVVINGTNIMPGKSDGIVG